MLGDCRDGSRVRSGSAEAQAGRAHAPAVDLHRRGCVHRLRCRRSVPGVDAHGRAVVAGVSQHHHKRAFQRAPVSVAEGRQREIQQPIRPGVPEQHSAVLPSCRGRGGDPAQGSDEREGDGRHAQGERGKHGVKTCDYSAMNYFIIRRYLFASVSNTTEFPTC